MAKPLKVLITSGATREAIDPVRFISNHSTGYMGRLLAEEALRRGHQVTVIAGAQQEPLPRDAVCVSVEQASDMQSALNEQSADADVVIMAAAVADYRPAQVLKSKQSRTHKWTLELEGIPDLIAQMPRHEGQIVVGFALETESVPERAQGKLERKQLDLVLAQEAGMAQAPFGRQTVNAWLLAKDGASEALGLISKPDVARLLLDKIEALWYRAKCSNAR